MREKFIQLCLGTGEISEAQQRARIGKMTSVVGFSVNFFLFLVKLLIGIWSASLAIIGDSVNNLTDSASSLISLLSFRISAKPADDEHPFGHARAEYLMSSVVAVIVMGIGLSLLKESVLRIWKPSDVNFTVVSFGILLFSILVKLWMSSFYFFVGEKIHSSMLRAMALDSRADVLSTTVVAIGFLSSLWLPFSLDGFLGLGVAFFILYSGFSILHETIDRILGVERDSSEGQEISSFLLSYEGVYDIHDLIVHDYGPGNVFASVHVEVDARKDMLDNHALIEKIESEAVRKLGVQLIIHMDLLFIEDEESNKMRSDAEIAIGRVDERLSLHDFRKVESSRFQNLVFDVDVPVECTLSNEELYVAIESELKKINREYHGVMTFDRKYIHSPVMGKIE